MTFNDLQNLASSFMQARAFLTAIELDLFTHIGINTLTTDEIARKCRASKRGIEPLLNALTSMGLLVRVKGGFKNTAIARQYLVRSGRDFRGDCFKHLYSLYNDWTELLNSIKTGKPIKKERDFKRFMLGMYYSGIDRAKELAKTINLKGAKKLLDLGSGPGTYSIEFLKRNANLKAVLVDYPEALLWAKRFARQTGLLKRMQFLEGDIFKIDPGNDYDALLISNVLHIYSENSNLKLLKRASGWLIKGGKIIINEVLLHNERTTPLSGTFFWLNMILHTEGGRSYTPQEIESWLLASGFSNPRMKNLNNRTAVLIATRG